MEIPYYNTAGKGITLQRRMPSKWGSARLLGGKSRILINFVRQQVNEENLYMTYSLINIPLLAFMFIYDTDLFTLGKPMKSAQSIQMRAQENIMNW